MLNIKSIIMKEFEIIKRLEKINNCLKEEKTGTTKEFAAKVGLSRSRLYDYLDYLKSYGIEIKYDSIKNSHVINGNVKIETQQPIRVLKNDELISTGGGEKIIATVRGSWTGTVLSLGFNSGFS